MRYFVVSAPLRRAFGVAARTVGDAAPAVVEVPLAGVLLAAILRLGLRVNLFPSAPRGLYRAVTGTPHSGSLDGGLRESGGCCSQACPWQSRAGAVRGCQARFYQPRSCC